MRSSHRLNPHPGLLLVMTAAAFLLSSGTAHAQSYWFESYQHAVRLIDRGQVDEAATLLDQVIKDHPVPAASMRIPGDRLMDYLPYFQRARVQFHQGDYAGAAHSLDIAQAFGEDAANRQTREQFLLLKERILATRASQVADRSNTLVPTQK